MTLDEVSSDVTFYGSGFFGADDSV
jgi:hypothetical protein